MAYQALYRKFRPADFDEVYGQEHIVTTLKNQLRADRVGHAYVFSGTRGTGKTSVAKIFAKVLNCESPVDGNPCGQCASCKKIAEGSSMNVMEIDAASNNGVDNIRSLIEDVSYPPIEGKRKVYIIDETHMLSVQAFNALLKTIEEPPEYAVFIFATTEVTTIPITILSRCQRYDFHRITVDDISGRMRELCIAEGLTVEDRALRYIARLADGSLRDALSMFDQCISYYYGQEITFDMTLKMLGASDNDMYSALFRALCEYDAGKALKIADEAVIRGMEPDTFVSGLTWYLRNLLLVKNGEKIEDVADISTEDAANFMEETNLSDNASIIRFITLLSELLADLKYAPVKRITMEIGMIRLCRPQLDEDYSALIARMDMIEKGVRTTKVPVERGQEAAPAQHILESQKEPPKKATVEQETSSPWEEMPPWDEDEFVEPVKTDEDDFAEPAKTVKENPAEPAKTESADRTKGFTSVWNAFLLTMSPMDRPYASKGVPVSRDNGSTIIYFDKKTQGGKFYSKPENTENLFKKIDEFMGKHYDVSIKVVDEKDLPKEKKDDSNGSGESAEDSFLKAAMAAGVDVQIVE